MILWMLWSIAFAVLVGLAAVASERALAAFGVARRHVWMIATVAAALVPPMLALARPSVRAQSPAPGAVFVAATAAPPPHAAPVVQPPFALPLARSAPRSVLTSATADRWALLVWALTSLSLAAGFARAMFVLRRKSRAWRETELGAYRALLSPDAGPAVIWFARPRIVVPQWALTLDAGARDLMLRHETEHIRAGDPRTLLAAGALIVVFPWNAALWMMVRQLRRAMELDCDARVVRAVGGPVDYGRVLLAVGERYTASLPLAASLAAPRPLLEQRISAMTTPRPRRPLVVAVPFAMIALAACVAASRAPRPATLETGALFPHNTQPVVAPARTLVALPIRMGPPLVSTHVATPATKLAAPTQSAPIRTPNVDKALVRALVSANYPKVVSGDAKADYVVLVFDAANKLVWGTPGVGSALISVGGDTLTSVQRLQMQARERGTPDFTGGNDGRGRLPERRPYPVSTMPVMSTLPNIHDATVMRDLNRQQRAGTNSAPGLVYPTPRSDDSGIDGIQASKVLYVDQVLFRDLAPSPLQVLAVHLTPDAPKFPAPGDSDTTGFKHAKVKSLVILPLPVPQNVKPYALQACFDVQATGESTLLNWTHSVDSLYDEKVHQGLMRYAFTPARRRDGTAVRDTVCVHARAG